MSLYKRPEDDPYTRSKLSTRQETFASSVLCGTRNVDTHCGCLEPNTRVFCSLAHSCNAAVSGCTVFIQSPKLAARYGLGLTYGPTKHFQYVMVPQPVTLCQSFCLSVASSTCSSEDMQQMAQESVRSYSADKLMCTAVTSQIWSREAVRSAIRFLWVKIYLPIEIHCHMI